MRRRRRKGTKPTRGAPQHRPTDRAPPPDVERQALQEAVREGVKVHEAKMRTSLEQIRADAQALETAARFLDDAPHGIFTTPKGPIVAAIFALSTGMRLASDRMPDPDEIPF